MRIKGIIICIFPVLAVLGCKEAPYVFPPENDFEYQVTGTSSRANITYQDLRGNYVELTNVTLPWSFQTHYFDNMVGITPVYLEAQSLDAGTTVTVTINAKRAPIIGSPKTSAGDSGFAIVYGTLP